MIVIIFKFLNVLQKLNPKHSISIDITQNHVEANLSCIYSNYRFLTTFVTSLENHKI